MAVVRGICYLDYWLALWLLFCSTLATETKNEEKDIEPTVSPDPTVSPSPSSDADQPPHNDGNNWCELLLLSDKELFHLGVERTIGTYCYIQVSSPGSGNACAYYVKGRPHPNSSYNGIPLTSEEGLGTGCVKQGPGSFCYFYDDRYPLTDPERESMCTSSLEANAAAQLRYGICNGYCIDDPTENCGCGGSATEPTPGEDTAEGDSSTQITPTGAPSLRGTGGVEPTIWPTDTKNYWCDLLQLSDNQLFQLGVERSIGTYCYIQVSNPDSGNACDFYVKGRPHANSSYNGIPPTSGEGLGTGCVKQGPGSFCYFYDNRYPLTDPERESMCTSSLEANAAAQLRYGIRNGYCMDDPMESCGRGSSTADSMPGGDTTARTQIEPTVSPSVGLGLEPTRWPADTDNYWCGLLNLSDDQLFQLGVGRSIGTYCYILVSNPDSGNACEFYVKGRPDPDSSNNGIPLTSFSLGTGCVEQNPGLACSFYDSSYPLTDNERDSMCSDSVVANAAAQMRFGIRNGYCMDDPNEGCGVGGSDSTTDSTATIDNDDVWSLATPEHLVFTDGISKALTFAASADSSRFVSVSGSGMLRVYNYTNITNGSWVLDLQREDPQTFGYNFVLQGSLQMQVARNATRWIVAHPFTEEVAVYSLENQEVQTIQAFGNGYNYTSDSVVIKVVNQAAVAINLDGSRIAMTLVVSETTYGAASWTNIQRAVRVYEYKSNATSGVFSYEPMGELLVLDNVTAHYGSKVQMDASGDTLFVGDNKGDDWDASAVFRYNSETAQWERFSSQPPPFGRLSPRGTRIASRDFQEESIRIFQLFPQSNEWRQIAVLDAPVKSESIYLPVDFGASMDWSENGETLIVGAPGEGRRFDGSGEVESGAVYVFEQSSCQLDPSGNPTNCSFHEVGRLPCEGAKCGSRVDISSNGLTFMYLLQGENGRPTLVRYTRGTPTTTEANNTSNVLQPTFTEAPTSVMSATSSRAVPVAGAPTSSPSRMDEAPTMVQGTPMPTETPSNDNGDTSASVAEHLETTTIPTALESIIAPQMIEEQASVAAKSLAVFPSCIVLAVSMIASF